MGMLFFDDTVRTCIKNLKDYSWKNKVTIKDIIKMIKGEAQPIGLDPNRNLIIGTHRIVYSLEYTNVGLSRHISISVLKKDGADLPSIPAVLEIMKEFGFRNKTLGKRSDYFNYWIEDVSKNEHAINVLESILSEKQLKE